MSRMVDDDDPIKTRAASKEYRDNWDRTFGEKEDPRVAAGPNVVVGEAPTIVYSCPACCDTGCVADPTADPSTFVTEADGLVNCDECSIRGKQLP